MPIQALFLAQNIAVQQGPPPGTFLSNEDQQFTLEFGALVRYGADGGFVQEYRAAGTHTCSTAAFGGTDPKPFVAKTCVIGS